MFGDCKQIQRARAALAELVEGAADDVQKTTRAACLDAFDRWARGERVDLFQEISRADTSCRDDVAEPMLEVLQRFRLL